MADNRRTPLSPLHGSKMEEDIPPGPPPLGSPPHGSQHDSPAPTDQTPDYRERLAYGTDQGRWLAQQTAGSDKPSGGRARPRTQRVMHSFDEWNSSGSPTTVVDDDDDERKKAQKPWRVNMLGLLALVLGAVVLVGLLQRWI